MNPLKHRTVLVTGAGGGIGAAIARGFARLQAEVVAVDRDRNSLHALTQEARQNAWAVESVPLDIRDREAVNRVFTQHAENLVAVVLCAGVTARATVMQTSQDQFQTLLTTNVEGTFYCLQAAANAMLRHQQGSIVVITSVNAQRPLPSQAVYSATKAALESLVKCLAVELGPAGIRVNAVEPGTIVTAMNEGHPLNVAHLPLARAGEPDDVVGAALFLSSFQAQYITGAVLAVDGGLLVQR